MLEAIQVQSFRETPGIKTSALGLRQNRYELDAQASGCQQAGELGRKAGEEYGFVKSAALSQWPITPPLT